MPQYQNGHLVHLLQGGQDFFPALIRDIDAAHHEVWLETYIYSMDESGVQVAQALVRAAGRGVKVRVVMDGAGTPALPLEWAASFDAAGVQWRIFSPLGRIGWFIPSRWRRLHRKLCMVDGVVAYCGGINILDDFYDPNHGALESPRFDFAVRVKGPLVRDVAQAMSQFWWRLQAVRQMRGTDFASAWAALQAAVRSMSTEVAAAPAGATRAALVLRDNHRQRTLIERAYRKAIGEARSEIIIANAYFLPGARLRKGLIHAAQRGIRVRLLLQGRYEYFMQYHAARPVYGALLAAGVEIHEYAPSFLHAKVAVIDSQWATVGSSNLDPLSLLLAREANVVIDDAVFAADLRERLDAALRTHGRQLDPQTYAQRPLRQRLLDRLAFGLMRLMLFLTGRRY